METTEITTQEQWVLHRLETFYSTDNRLQKLKNILEGKTNISLRILDWFVTNYAKKNNISYITSTGKHIIVYLMYKSHLKAYSKKMFDPFCRWNRINFHDISTTVGQLNFFAWVMDDGVLDYIIEHRDEIHSDMETRMGSSNKKEHTTTRKKRHELSHSATKSLKKHDINITVNFS
jgi:phosphopantetheine adenylyltransferase